MSFKQILDKYLAEFRREIEAAATSGEATAELSFRTSLDNFFKVTASTINATIVTIPEPKNQNKVGRPDWRFHDSESMGVYGYVEAKGLDAINVIDVPLYKDQVGKYLTLGNPVILTDGIDFVLFNPDGTYHKYSVCDKPVKWDSLNVNYGIETLFSTFFGKTGYRTVSERQLVDEVAKRAKLLTSDIEILLDLEENEAENASELTTLKLLKKLQGSAEISHDKTLANRHVFASFVSQILTFGLLYAHRVTDDENESPQEKYRRIHDFWFSLSDEAYTSQLVPFKTLVNELKNELSSNLSSIGLWYDDLRRRLSYIRLTKSQLISPDFHELYETFLTVYDPSSRFDYGAFYTPRALAFYVTALAKEIVVNSIPGVDFASPHNKIIDPCCGTGTFIEAVLECIKPSTESQIIGFEILPAPYALAHYRMMMINKNYLENVRIILTNTLSDRLFELIGTNAADDTIENLLVTEQQKAYQLAAPPLTLIIGNPPSSDSKKVEVENEGNIIKSLVEDFKPHLDGRTSRQNTQKQTSNESLKFLRWVVERATQGTPSAFALILPSSFAKHPSYKYARKYLTENFNELWVLDFDSDNRRGTGDTNLFNTLQGRLVLVGVVDPDNTEKAKILYRTITDLSRVEKLAFFENRDISLGDWTDLAIDHDNYTMKPALDYNKELYEKLWPISGKSDFSIFKRHCSSLKLAPTHLLVHASLGQLSRRTKFISKEENDYESIKDKWYSGQRKPPQKAKITSSVRAKLATAVNSNSILDYSYRPFIEAKVLLNEDLLSTLQDLGGGGTRDRPEVRAAYADSRVIGFAISPAPEDIGSSLHKFTSFCWHIPDNDLSARGNAHVFCNLFPEYKTGKNWDPTLKSNLNDDLIAQLSTGFLQNQESVAINLVFYSYAILSSNFFLETFKGILFNVAGEYPRIPITTSEELFYAVAKYGEELAKIESSSFKMGVDASDMSDVMYHKYDISPNTIKLKNESGAIVRQFVDIPDAVLNFEVSGYNVIKEWLKIHSYPYFRRSLDNESAIELETLLLKIPLYLDVIEKVDVLVEDILEGDLYLPAL